MLDLDKFIFWQKTDLSGYDKMLLLSLLVNDFHFHNIPLMGTWLTYLFSQDKILPYYDYYEHIEYKYHFEYLYMLFAFKLFEDEMHVFKSEIDNASWDGGIEDNEDKILELSKLRKNLEDEFIAEKLEEVFGGKLLAQTKKTSLESFSFKDEYVENGSLGKVKIGEDQFHRHVAVKLNPVWRQSDVKVLEVLIEKKSLTPKHPNLIQIFDIGLDIKKRTGNRYEYTYFYSMEQADNLSDDGSYYSKSLANIIERHGKLTPPQVVYVLVQALCGLKSLHDAGLCHGGIHPENILFVDNIPKLAEVTSKNEEFDIFTIKNTIIPTDLQGTKTSTSSMAGDLYALAMCAYRALTGLSERLFPEVPFDVLRTSEGRKLNKILSKACSPQVKSRYVSVDDFLEELQGLSVEETPALFHIWTFIPKGHELDVYTEALGEDVVSKLDDVKLKDYKVVKNFRGAGGFGDVRIYEHDVWDFRAIKRVNINNPRARQEAESVLLYKEKAPEHPHLIKIFDIGYDSEIIDGHEEHFFFYTMEAADNLFGLCHPNLRHYQPVILDSLKYKDKEIYIQSTENENEYMMASLWLIMKNLLEGLSVLHNTGLVHRDIKPDNLVFVKGVLKISDVGLVTSIDTAIDLAGTGGYLPPEYFKELELSEQMLMDNAVKNDLYATGITMLNVFNTGQYDLKTFAQMEDSLYGEAYKDGCIQLHIKKYFEIVSKMSSGVPEKRPSSVEEVLADFPDDDDMYAMGYPDALRNRYDGSTPEGAMIDYDNTMVSIGRNP
jgi:serine/threonine protein kinase